MGVVAWSTWAGDLIRGGPASGILGIVPVPVGPAYRLATTWATARGIALSLAVVALAGAAIAPTLQRLRPASYLTRESMVLTVVAVALHAVLVLDLLPAPAGASVPAFAQAPSAALAPLAALVSLACLVLAGARALASRAVAMPAPRDALVLVAWVGATVALGAEQVARADLGIGPSDPVTLGSAASGLVLWLLASALLHRRVARSIAPALEASAVNRWAGWLAHVGAVLVVASFAAHVLAQRSTLVLPPGEVVHMEGAPGGAWLLVNQGVSRYDAAAADVTALAIEATPPGGEAVLVTTARSDHAVGRGRTISTSVRGSAGGPFMRLRILLDDVDLQDTARVRVTALPLPVLWDAGMLMLAAAAVIMVVGLRGTRPSFPAP
jgi:hypothetical protein